MNRFSTRAVVAAALMSVTLAGCQTDGTPIASSPAASQRVITPTPASGVQATGFSDETSTQTRTVSDDGRTVRTETRSGRVSVNADGALAALLGGATAAPVFTATDYAGTWRVTNAENRECRMTLRAAPTPTATAQASTFGCFGQPLFSVNRWSLRGNELVLTDGFNTPLVSLRATGPNRLEGGGVVMFR